ncbi:hypothetical protein [Erythrobacter ani]|uniref:Lipocalin-like domain-containing protein n=1 Tax=Erythrobacter ani TaxID=2827235 RepID=A0ABS6SMN0_9SPHN|nr:hypothetical protein [Erythrobacter ani]MBV7266291.1 hypothetical protein [Erythrobacter ani]
MKRKQLFKRIFLSATLFAPIAILIPASASSQPKNAGTIPLSEIAGQWRGDGWAVREEGGTKEGVRCRLKTRYKSGSRKLTISGKCAATSGTYTLLGHIADYPDTNRVTGRWVNPRGVGVVNIAGKRTGNRLTFFYEGKDKETKEKVRYKTVWDLSGDGFSLSTGVGGGANDELGKITFRR